MVKSVSSGAMRVRNVMPHPPALYGVSFFVLHRLYVFLFFSEFCLSAFATETKGQSVYNDRLKTGWMVTTSFFFSCILFLFMSIVFLLSLSRQEQHTRVVQLFHTIDLLHIIFEELLLVRRREIFHNLLEWVIEMLIRSSELIDGEVRREEATRKYWVKQIRILPLFLTDRYQRSEWPPAHTAQTDLIFRHMWVVLPLSLSRLFVTWCPAWLEHEVTRAGDFHVHVRNSSETDKESIRGNQSLCALSRTSS